MPDNRKVPDGKLTDDDFKTLVRAIERSNLLLAPADHQHRTSPPPRMHVKQGRRWAPKPTR